MRKSTTHQASHACGVSISMAATVALTSRPKVPAEVMRASETKAARYVGAGSSSQAAGAHLVFGPDPRRSPSMGFIGSSARLLVVLDLEAGALAPNVVHGGDHVPNEHGEA